MTTTDTETLCTKVQDTVIPSLLADDYKWTRINYNGLLSQSSGALERGLKNPHLAEALCQLKGNLRSLGIRWYAGDTTVVDKFLQLYCVEPDARAAVKNAMDTQTAKPLKTA